ncbi:MAG: mucoidy inhibitor MuiA family protein [Deltaproteobacteria bacterium]|nr:mucoidy inhibitor MuiA family protein [Deltaproteobacteria bacterium]
MHLLPLLLVAASVPAVSAGPELEASARSLDAPVSAVTVFSDRARVQRRASLSLPAGTSIVALPDIPGAAMISSVRVDVTAGKVIRVETRPVEEARMTLPEVEALLSKLEKLADTQAELDARVTSLNRELSYLGSVGPALPVPESERVGKPAPTVKPAVWKSSLDFLDARRDAIHAELRKEEAARRELTKKIQEVQTEIGRHDLGAASLRRLKVLAILESGSKASATLTLSYDVPGAAWWPTYELHFSPQEGNVKLAYAGLVQQTTGESWSEVDLFLSTAIPGQTLAVPELLTWTLGEHREMIPQPRPEQPLPRPVALRVPPARPSSAIIDRRVEREVLAARLNQLRTLASSGPTGLASTFGSTVSIATAAPTGGAGYGYGIGAGSVGGLASRGAPAPDYYQNMPAEAPAPPPSRPQAAPRPSYKAKRSKAEAGPSAAPSMAFDDYEVAGELAEAESVSLSSRSSLARGPGASSSSLALYDPNAWRRPTFGDRTLPAMVAGGFDYVFPAPTTASVESGPEKLKVPLSMATWKAELLYEATPAIQKTAYLTAKVKNATKQPILAGKMSIFVDGDFAGEGSLDTTGPGGELALPLGADEDIRLEHHVAPKTRTEGLVSKEEITDYAVHIEVGNYKKRAVSVHVYDVLPKTNNEDIEVKLLSSKPEVSDGPDAKGRLRWELTLKPGETRKIDFTYSIRRPKDWQLTQR